VLANVKGGGAFVWPPTPQEPAATAAKAERERSADVARQAKETEAERLARENEEVKKQLAAPVAIGSKALALDCGDGVRMELGLVPAGTFVMGSPEGEFGRDDDESPQHEVTLTQPFYIGIYEVTQEQYKTVIGRNPSALKAPRLPVEGVSWDDADAFCRQLSKRLRRTVRLPTEAEWEYACRAGTMTPFCSGGGDKDLADVAWFAFNLFKHPYPHIGGEKKPNAWGLYDMHGNVSEWCQDWYSENYYTRGRRVDPLGPAQGVTRVQRGGGCASLPMHCRSASRSSMDPGMPFGGIGFRVVVEMLKTP
jgi:formylglycine-generating enzyme required for sulfatase activity